MITNRTRDLARQTAAYIDDATVRADLARLIPAFFWLAAQTLRKERGFGPHAERLLTDSERAALDPITFRAPVVTGWISSRLRAEASANRLAEQRLQSFELNLISLNDSLGGAERILRTPIPFAYAQHIKIFVVLFCFSAPFVMADVMGWITPIASAFLAIALFGIDEIGVEIEEPFGDDPNDLPLDTIGNGIEKAVSEIVSAGRRDSATAAAA
jgi:putative membrane protein